MFLPEHRPGCEYVFPTNPQLQDSYSPSEWRDLTLRGQCWDNIKGNPSADPSAQQIRASLQGNELWAKFREIGTEMIITKSGRRMFPSCKISVAGLDPTAKYTLLMDMVPVDNCKYKWAQHRWEPHGLAEPHLPSRFFLHPDSPASGERWMQYPVSFHRLKLTNNTLSTSGLVILHSMHKYVPRLHVIRSQDHGGLPRGSYTCFTFPEAAFIAVTAYQNSEVTKLKIDNNPFAKGFREHGLNSKRFRGKGDQKTCKRVLKCLPESAAERTSGLKAGESNCEGDDTVSSSNDSHMVTGGVLNHKMTAFMKSSSGPTEMADSSARLEPWSSGLPNVGVPLPRHSLLCQLLSDGVPQLPQPFLPMSSKRSAPTVSEMSATELELLPPNPPKISRAQLPESALWGLELAPPFDTSSPHPLANILNRIQGKGLASVSGLGKPPWPSEGMLGCMNPAISGIQMSNGAADPRTATIGLEFDYTASQFE